MEEPFKFCLGPLEIQMGGGVLDPQQKNVYRAGLGSILELELIPIPIPIPGKRNWIKGIGIGIGIDKKELKELIQFLFLIVNSFWFFAMFFKIFAELLD